MGIIDFGNFREMSVKIGKDRKFKKKSNAFRKTPSDGMHPAFSGRHSKLFIVSDLYRVVPEISEVHADIARSFLKCIIPLLP